MTCREPLSCLVCCYQRQSRPSVEFRDCLQPRNIIDVFLSSPPPSIVLVLRETSKPSINHFSLSTAASDGGVYCIESGRVWHTLYLATLSFSASFPAFLRLNCLHFSFNCLLFSLNVLLTSIVALFHNPCYSSPANCDNVSLRIVSDFVALNPPKNIRLFLPSPRSHAVVSFSDYDPFR